MMLRYTVYKMLQDFVHVGHTKQKRLLLRELDVHKSSRPTTVQPIAVLELACGGGNLASVFPPNTYYGIDLAADRVAAARQDNPDYRFGVGDVDGPQFNELVRNFDFIFCHGLLHHLDDQQCRRLLEAVQLNSRRPTTFVAIEPVLPVIWRNPLGYILAKMDDGDYIRPPLKWRQLLGNVLVRSEQLDFFPRWPGSEEVYILRFLD